MKHKEQHTQPGGRPTTDSKSKVDTGRRAPGAAEQLEGQDAADDVEAEKTQHYDAAFEDGKKSP
jgi:hypothetical protein